MIYGKAGGAASLKGTTLRKRTARDANEPAIIEAIKQIGGLVQPITAKGCPDLLVLYRRRLMLFEIKDGSKIPSKRRLTDDQKRFHEEWSEAPIFVIETIQDAMQAMSELG